MGEKLIYTNSRGRSIEISNSTSFLLTSFDPGVPQSNIITSKAPGQDGKTYHGTVLDERPPSIEGSIMGDSVEDMYEKRKELCNVFNPKLMGTLIYTNGYKTYKISCTPQETPVFKDKSGVLQDFLIQLFCPNPYWLNIEENKEEIALWQGDFEFDLEITDDGIEMGHRVSTLIVNALNNGDVQCGMRVEFTALATVSNPSILNVYTQEFIKVKRTLTAGDKIIINTEFGHKRVEMVQNGVITNVFNYIDLQSTFLQLDVGDNLLRYDAESGIDNLEVSIYFTQKYVGV